MHGKRSVPAITLLVFVTLSTTILVFATQPCQAADSPCADAALSHQFDFWLGHWDVTAAGAPAGTSHIEPILGGCVVQEHWSGASGSAGSSLNFYNPSTKKWHQFWVWQGGTTLELEGGLENGKMVFAGDGTDKTGKKVRNRITWTPNADGTVRQLWESSSDGGKSWQSLFDGLYRRKK